jgi:predicted DCC family thiol-disulfide oxidoreductase YuxK
VRFLLAEDRLAAVCRFAPLQGPTFEEVVPEAERSALADSIVLVRGDGTLLQRSDAIGRLLLGLGGFWRLLGHALLLVPRPLRDAGYDLVAVVRKRIFAQPKGLCPLLPPSLGARFDP